MILLGLFQTYPTVDPPPGTSDTPYPRHFTPSPARRNRDNGKDLPPPILPFRFWPLFAASIVFFAPHYTISGHSSLLPISNVLPPLCPCFLKTLVTLHQFPSGKEVFSRKRSQDDFPISLNVTPPANDSPASSLPVWLLQDISPPIRTAPIKEAPLLRFHPLRLYPALEPPLASSSRWPSSQCHRAPTLHIPVFFNNRGEFTQNFPSCPPLGFPPLRVHAPPHLPLNSEVWQFFRLEMSPTQVQLNTETPSNRSIVEFPVSLFLKNVLLAL